MHVRIVSVGNGCEMTQVISLSRTFILSVLSLSLSLLIAIRVYVSCMWLFGLFVVRSRTCRCFLPFQLKRINTCVMTDLHLCVFTSPLNSQSIASRFEIVQFLYE